MTYDLVLLVILYSTGHAKIGYKFNAEKSAHMHEFAIFNKNNSVCIFQSQVYARICMASIDLRPTDSSNIESR